MVFKQETLTEALLEEAKPLLEKHWNEIAFYKDIPLDPDYTQYLLLEKLGMIRSFSARDGEGKLVGYAVYMVAKNPHYKTSVQAKEDIIYIDPERRGMGMFFIKFCDEELKKIGVQVVSHHVKYSHDWSAAAEKIGYEKQEFIITRRLDR